MSMDSGVLVDTSSEVLGRKDCVLAAGVRGNAGNDSSRYGGRGRVGEAGRDAEEGARM